MLRISPVMCSLTCGNDSVGVACLLSHCSALLLAKQLSIAALFEHLLLFLTSLLPCLLSSRLCLLNLDSPCTTMLPVTQKCWFPSPCSASPPPASAMAGLTLLAPPCCLSHRRRFPSPFSASFQGWCSPQCCAALKCSNYSIDIAFLLEHCPALLTAKQLVLLHGSRAADLGVTMADINKELEQFIRAAGRRSHRFCYTPFAPRPRLSGANMGCFRVCVVAAFLGRQGGCGALLLHLHIRVFGPKPRAPPLCLSLQSHLLVLTHLPPVPSFPQARQRQLAVLRHFPPSPATTLWCHPITLHP